MHTDIGPYHLNTMHTALVKHHCQRFLTGRPCRFNKKSFDHPNLLVCRLLACACQTILYPSQLASIGGFISHHLNQVKIGKRFVSKHIKFLPSFTGKVFYNPNLLSCQSCKWCRYKGR